MGRSIGSGRTVAAGLAVLVVAALLWWVLGSGPEAGNGYGSGDRDGASSRTDVAAEPASGSSGSGASNTSTEPGGPAAEVLDPLAPVIRGRVVDSRGRGIAGARVQSSTMPTGTARFDFIKILRELDHRDPVHEEVECDAEGRFALRRTGTGSWRLRASAEGYAPRFTEALPLRPMPPDTGPVIEIVVAPGYPVEGRVEDAAGVAVAGARIVLFPQPRGDVPSFEKSHTETGPDGSFRFDAMAPGRFVAIASAPGRPMRINDRAQVPQSAPLVITLDGSASLAVTVVDEEEAPLSGAEVFLAQGMRGPSGAFARGSTDAKGVLLLESLPAGKADMLTVNAVGFVPHMPGGPMGGGDPIPDLVAGERRELRVTLRRGTEVHGRVLRRDDRAPIAGARVRAIGMLSMFASGDNSVLSAADGTFRLIGVPVGHSVLMADATGYAQAPGDVSMAPADPGDDSGSSIDVKEGDTVVEKDILLDAAARLKGVVHDPDGAPVGGAVVEWQTQVRGGMIPGFAAPGGSNAVAAADGSFELTSLPPGGDFVLRATAPGYLWGETAKLNLAPGEERTGIVVGLRAGSVVAGTVLGADGKPLDGAMVTGAPKSERWSLENDRGGTLPARTDPDGRFEIRAVESGPYFVRAVAEGHVPGLVETVAGENGSDSIVLSLVAAASLEGRVVDEAGAPIADAQVGVRAQGDAHNSAVAPASTRSGADGKFRIDNLPRTEPLAVNASSPDHLPNRVEGVIPGGTPVLVTLTLGLRISGTVVDEAGVPQAGLNVQASGEGVVNRNRTATDASGAFVLKGLPRGAVELRISGNTTDPDLILAPLRDVRTGTEGVVWTLQRGLAVTGRVVDTDGQPAAGVRVRAEAVQEVEREGAGSSGSTRSEEDGSFRIARLDAGKFRISGTGGAYLPGEPVEAVAGGEPVVLKMRRGEIIAGIVVDKDGKPVRGARVGLRRDGRIRWAFSGADGQFRYEGLEPGTADIALVDRSFGMVRPDDARVTWTPVQAGDKGVRLGQ